MNEYSIVVDFQKGNIYTDLSILVQNDYNAYKLNFEFDKEFERALFKLKYPVDNKEWVQDIVDNKLILPVLKDTGDYEYEISIYSEDGRLTGYATEKFHVRSELINTDEIVEPDDRVPVLDNLINETTQLKNETASLKEEVEDAIEETNNLNIDVSDKVNKEVNITLTKKDNTTKRVTLKDGTSLMFNWDGTRLGIKTDEDEEYVYVDLIGRTGPMGPQGEAFQVKKTYANINLMIADYDNMQINDYVMIDGNIEQEDNAKLFVKQEIEDPTYRWHYLADFSGATGIQGPTGLTPNIQIGTVTSGNTPSISRTGTNENPILNFVLQQGPQGEIGPTGATGETGNGILNIVKLSSIDNIDTYQINMTDGTYYQFTVTNSNVTNQEFDDLKNRYESLINTLPRVTGTGTDITLDNTSEYYMESILNSTELTQDGTPASDNPVDVNVITGSNNVKLESKNLFNKNNINDFYSYQTNVTINDDKSITITGDSNSGAHYAVLRPFHQFKIGKTYTISFDYEGNLGQMIMFKTLWETQGNRTTTKRLTFSITENDTTLLGLGFYVDTNRTLKVYNIQIEEGSTATEYVEHQEQNYPITLSSKNLFNPIYYLNSTFRTVTYKYTQTNVKGNRNLYFKAKVKEGKTPYDDLYVALSTEGTNPNSGITIFSIKRGIPQTTDLSKDYTGYNTLYLSFYPTTYTWEQINEVYDFWIATEDIEYSPYIANPLEYYKIGDYADELIRTSGKNLFNIEGNINTRYNGSTGNYNSTVSNKLITTYSTNNGYPYGQRIYVGAGNKITISGVVSNIEATGSKETVIMCFNDNTTNNYQSTTFTDSELNTKKSFSFIPETDYIIIAFAGKYSGFVTATFTDIQVEYGNATDYEPYGENEWYLKKNIGKVTFDGSDDEVYEKVYGSIYNNKCLYYLRNIPHNNSDYNLMKSNRFVATAGVSEYYQEGINVSYNAGYLGLVLEADKLTEYTTDALRIFFQNNNTDVYLVTETPTYIHISETDYPILRSQLENLYNNAKSYKGQTNITQTNDGLPFNIELSALRDLSTL